MRIAIYGGSFNPIHCEHKNILLYAMKQFDIDKAYVVPSKIAPHKPNAVPLAFEHRFNMLSIAFDGEKNVQISDFENSHDGLSYTYLTIKYFRELYPLAELYFLVGTDMLYDFPTWKNPDIILKEATLIVTKRDGDNFEKADERYRSHFDKKYLLSTYIGTSLSSSKINNYLSLELQCRNLMPEGVEKYLKDNSLITTGALERYVIKSLKPSRIKHTANVMTLAQKYAKKLGESVEKASTAALLHDVAKYMSPQDWVGFKTEHFVPAPVVHQYLGAYVAKNVLGVTDGDVLNAIRYHTSGRANMSKLEKIIFLADLLEEDRNFDGVDEIRRAVDDDFESGFRYAVKCLNEFLKKSNSDVYFLTEECLKSLN